MTKDDLEKFSSLWSNVNEMFNKQVNESTIKIAFVALREYDYNTVGKALMYVVQTSRFAPTVADVIEVIKQQNGEDKESLINKASQFYAEINATLDSGCDYVCSDPRGVYAFKLCFGSIREFGRHSDKTDSFDRKAFIEAYVNARNYPNNNFLCGINHETKSPRVRFIGNKRECQTIAQKYYSVTGQTPSLPNFTNVKKTLNQLNVCKVESNNPLQVQTDINEVIRSLTHGK